MKTKTLRVSKSVLSMMLALVMVMLVAIVPQYNAAAEEDATLTSGETGETQDNADDAEEPKEGETKDEDANGEDDNAEAPENKLPFTDVDESAWYYDSVAYVYENGIFGGTSDDTFSPSADMTRGMIVTALWRMAGEPAVEADDADANTDTDANADDAKTEGDADADDNADDDADTKEETKIAFTDVADDAYYAAAVAWAAKNEIVTGYSDTEFRPASNVTREQLAAILLRYMNYVEYNPIVTQELRIFADSDEISGYASNAIQTLNKLGVLTGVGENMINPKGNASRAQVATMIDRLSGLIAADAADNTESGDDTGAKE